MMPVNVRCSRWFCKSRSVAVLGGGERLYFENPKWEQHFEGSRLTFITCSDRCLWLAGTISGCLWIAGVATAILACTLLLTGCDDGARPFGPGEWQADAGTGGAAGGSSGAGGAAGGSLGGAPGTGGAGGAACLPTPPAARACPRQPTAFTDCGSMDTDGKPLAACPSIADCLTASGWHCLEDCPCLPTS